LNFSIKNLSKKCGEYPLGDPKTRELGLRLRKNLKELANLCK